MFRKVYENVYFNPRSPYGERPEPEDYSYGESKFQSTLPLRGATISSGGGQVAVGISIHAPLTGSDKRSHAEKSRIIYFNPRSPYGERPALQQAYAKTL